MRYVIVFLLLFGGCQVQDLKTIPILEMGKVLGEKTWTGSKGELYKLEKDPFKNKGRLIIIHQGKSADIPIILTETKWYALSGGPTAEAMVNEAKSSYDALPK